MNKFTEGPWKLEYHNDRFTGDVLAPNGSEVCTTWNHSQHGETFDKEVNARLIAAAPDLLEALKFAQRFYQDNFENFPIAYQSVVDFADAAIAKAEGSEG